MNTARLGDVSDFIRGITFKPDDVVPLNTPGSVACLRTKNVQSELDLSDVWAVPTSFVKGEDRFTREGDMVMSTANSWNLVGKVAWIPKLEWKATVGGFVSLLRPKTEIVDARYLFRWIGSDHAQALLRSCARQTTNISNLSIAQAEALEIPLPHLEEQKRIAAILDQADALRRLRARALDRLNALGQAIFHEMFGVRIADGQLPLAELGTLARNLDGQRVPVKKSDRSEAQGKFPYYGASGIIDFVDDFLFEGPHLLVAEDGANLLSRSTPIAFMAIGQFWVNNHAHVLAYNGKAELDFLRFFLETLDLAPYVTGSAQPKLNQKKLNQILTPVPPLSEQRRFVAILRKLELEIIEVQRGQQASETLFTSLQHRAFRGEL